jgi:predicted  nucleic acid-binding Zn-ribbon protein
MQEKLFNYTERRRMKFKLHLDSDEFLTCNSCGNDDFDFISDKKLTDDKKYRHFLFFGCPNCAGAGFWTHHKTINEKNNFGLAIARCKAIGTLRVTAA